MPFLVWTVYTLASLLLLTGTVCDQAEPSPAIVRIVAQGCAPENHERSQTGFVVVDPPQLPTPVIATALHGVANCATITAIANGAPIDDLVITQIDLQRDVALLTIGAEQQTLSASTYLTATHEPLTDSNGKPTAVCAVGYPAGIKDQWPYRTLHLQSRTKDKLYKLLPPDQELIAAFNQRQSPSRFVNVLRIEGELAHGVSGAPLLNEAGAVIGIIEGGLKDADADTVSWAIPWADIEWEAADGEILSSLEPYDPRLVFAVDSLTTPTPTPQPTAKPISAFSNQLFEQTIGNVTYKLTEVKQEADGIKVWIVARNEGVSTSSAICSYANGNVGFCRIFDDDGNQYDGKFKGGFWSRVTLPAGAPFRFEISFPLRNVDNISVLEIPVLGGLIEFHDIPVPYMTVSEVSVPISNTTTQIYEQTIGNVTYKLVEVTQDAAGITAWVVAQNEGVSTPSAICSYANGNVGFCRFFDGAGNQYDGKFMRGLWSRVTFPSDAPFRIEISFPARGVTLMSVLEIPISGGLIEFHDVPVPYKAPESQQKPTSATDIVGQVFGQTVGNVTYKVMEVTQEGSNVKVWVVAKNEGVSLQSAICSYANGNIGFCRFFDDAGNSYDGAYNGRIWSYTTLPSNAPFRFEISFPAREITNMSVLEIPVSGGLIEFHNVPIPYKAPE